MTTNFLQGVPSGGDDYSVELSSEGSSDMAPSDGDDAGPLAEEGGEGGVGSSATPKRRASFTMVAADPSDRSPLSSVIQLKCSICGDSVNLDMLDAHEKECGENYLKNYKSW